MLLNQEINLLLNDKMVRSNHINDYWNVLFNKQSYITFTSRYDVLKLDPLELEASVTSGSYLVELEVPNDNILSIAPYHSYVSLTKYLRKHKPDVLREIYARTQEDLSCTPFNAVIIDTLTRDMIVNVYRCNPIPPYWVRCEMEGNKLIHKLA